VWVRLDNLWATLTRSTEQDVQWLDQYLSFESDQARFSPAVQAGHWDGRYRLFDGRHNRFPAGLLGTVSKAYGALGGPSLEVQDVRVKVQATASWRESCGAWLRDYQRDALAACIQQGRGIIKAPTGAGKTEIIAALCQAVPGRWVVVAHKRDLMHQTADRIKLRTGEQCGLAGDGEWRPARITCCTFQTLVRGLRSPAVRTLLDGLSGLVVDECHSIAAQTFYKVLMGCPAYYRIGFSGTPLDRGDRRNVYVVAATGPRIYSIEASRLIQEGVLSRPTIHMVPCRQRLADGLGWQEVYRRGVVESEQRNQLVASIANSRPGPTLVFIKNIEHGRLLERLIQRRGLRRCEFVWGQDSSRERQQAITKLQRQDVDVLVTSSIFEEGVDIPQVRCVVVASGGKSTIRTLQRLGRGMRVSEGKSTMELWDLDDQGHRWLDMHSGLRLAAYSRDGYRVLQIPPDQANMMVRQFA
jgi:superfamily II DNA or RNA helicase